VAYTHSVCARGGDLRRRRFSSRMYAGAADFFLQEKFIRAGEIFVTGRLFGPDSGRTRGDTSLKGSRSASARHAVINGACRPCKPNLGLKPLSMRASRQLKSCALPREFSSRPQRVEKNRAASCAATGSLAGVQIEREGSLLSCPRRQARNDEDFSFPPYRSPW